jgi:hypothetical protein
MHIFHTIKTQTKFIILILAGSILLGLKPISAQPSQALTENWRDTDFNYNGSMMETDTDGNAYVLGDNIATYVLNLRKYAANGMLLWQTTYDDPAYNLRGVRLALDNAKNVIVVGNTVSSSTGQPFGWKTIKYDTNGNLLWEHLIFKSFSGAARLNTDQAGNIYVVGTGTLTKLSPSGTVLWQDDSGMIGQPYSMAISIDGARIAIAGKSGITGLDYRVNMYDAAGNRLWTNISTNLYPANDIIFQPNFDYVTYVATGTYFATDPNPYQMVIVKYDAAGNTIWQNSYRVGDRVYRLAYAIGNVYATGVDSNGYLDWMTIAVDSNGTLLWSQRYDGTRNIDETPNMIKTSAFDGGVYVTGKGGPSPSSGTISNLKGVVVKYNRLTGAPQWAQWDDYAGGLSLSLSSVDPMGQPLSFVTLGWGYLTTAKYTGTGLPELVPAAPGNLTTSLGYKLTFTDNAINEFWVDIERCPGIGCTNFAKIGQTKGENATGYDDTTVVAGNSYTYRTRAYGFMGYSDYSNTATLGAAPVNPPAAPSGLSATAVSKSQINLAWTNPTGGQSGIKIERCKGTSCSNFTMIATMAGTASSFSNTGLSGNTSYRYRVRAYNSVGNSSYSNITNATTLRR